MERHPQEPEVSNDELAARIALVRAAKAKAAGDLSLAALDAVLPAVDSARTRALQASWRERNQARQNELVQSWRQRNLELVRERDRYRKRRERGSKTQ